jgi:hypothetical protein
LCHGRIPRDDPRNSSHRSSCLIAASSPSATATAAPAARKAACAARWVAVIRPPGGDRDPDCLRGSKVDNKIEYFRTPLLLSAVLISERIEQFHQNRTQFRGAFSEGEFFAPDHSTNSVTEFNRRRMVRTVQPTHQGLGRLSDRTLGAEFGYKRLVSL